MSNVIIFLGPPAIGKGTQGKIISERMKIPHISVGDLLRQEVNKKSEIGKIIKYHMINANRRAFG